MIPKILHITLRADFGGGPEHVFRLISELKADINCFVACPNDYPYFEKYVRIIGRENVFTVPHRSLSLSSILKLKNFIKRNDIKIIHSHGKGAGVYSRILKLISPNLKIVHTFHGIHIGNYSSLQKNLYIYLEKIFSSISSKLIAVSESEYLRVLELNLCKKNKLSCINNGVAIPNIKEKIKNNKFEVISITRFDFQKNSELTLKIAQHLLELNELDQFHFNFIGTGEGEDKLKLAIEKMKLNNFFTFWGTTQNPISILEQKDCYISTSRWEGLPIAVLEAMSCSLPVVGSKVVGHTEVIIHGKNGFLFELDKPKLAAKYLVELKNNVKLQNEFSKNSRDIVIKNFGVDKMAAKTLDVYRELITNNA